jgi:hypothetical protein
VGRRGEEELVFVSRRSQGLQQVLQVSFPPFLPPFLVLVLLALGEARRKVGGAAEKGGGGEEEGGRGGGMGPVLLPSLFPKQG